MQHYFLDDDDALALESCLRSISLSDSMVLFSSRGCLLRLLPPASGSELLAMSASSHTAARARFAFGTAADFAFGLAAGTAGAEPAAAVVVVAAAAVAEHIGVAIAAT